MTQVSQGGASRAVFPSTKEFIELYDGLSGGAYHGGRYLSNAIYTPAKQGGSIVLPTTTPLSEQSLQKLGLENGWTSCRCLRGKHAERYDEQSLCLAHAHASLDELCSVAASLLQTYDLTEVLIKEAATGKVFKFKPINK